MKQLEYVLNNEMEVLGFIKNHYPMYHLSNVFFRDVQFGIQKMFELRGEKIQYTDAEKIAKQFAEKLEKSKIFNRIDGQSWALNYPEFKKPAVVQATPAKPAPGAAPAKSAAATPAAGRPALPPLGGAKPATPVGAKPALPPLAGAKPVDGTKPTLPPLSSAKPVGSTKSALPPLTSAKPVGGAKPALPPLTSAKPVAANPAAISAPAQVDASVVQEKVAKEAKAAPVTQPASASPTPTPTGEKKSLPPLRGNYTPAGKK